MQEEYSCKSGLIGLFGQPIWENPTEHMMEAAFRYHNLPFRYISAEVSPKNLADAFAGVKAMGYKGFNCTLPHKQAIIPLLDDLGESAKKMGAVNCVVERDGKYIGENTDGKGYVESLKEITTISNKNIVILGAGGAARAISIELALEKVNEIKIVNRSYKNGQALTDLINQKTGVRAEFIQLNGDFAVPENTDIVINATSIGLYPDKTKVPIALDSLKPAMIVSDVIPNPPQTAFLQEAAKRKCTTIDGLGMLVNQGKIAIRYWTGVEANAEVMRQALEEI